MLSWIIDQIPLWAYVVAVLCVLAVLYFYFGAILIPIWNALPKWVKTVIYFLLAIGAAFVLGRNKAARDFKERQDNLNAKAVQKRQEIHDEVSNLDKPATDKRLDEWLRDK